MDNKNTLAPRDHDMLVVLNTKVDQLTFDIKEIKDNIITRIAKAEARLDAIDLYHAAVPLKEYGDLAKWVDTFRSNYKLIITFGGIFAGIIGAIFEKIIQNYFRF